MAFLRFARNPRPITIGSDANCGSRNRLLHFARGCGFLSRDLGDKDMRWFSVSAAVLATVVLSGCTTKEEFEAGRKIVGESPAARQEVEARCLRSTWGWSTYQQRFFAQAMKTSDSNAPALFCRRVVAALLSGRLTYEEVNKPRRVSEAKLFRVIQGR